MWVAEILESVVVMKTRQYNAICNPLKLFWSSVSYQQSKAYSVCPCKHLLMLSKFEVVWYLVTYGMLFCMNSLR